MNLLQELENITGVNKERRDKIREKLQNRILNAQEQLEMLDALENYEIYGQPSPPFVSRNKKK